MPTVAPETEALHFFRAVEALIFSVLGTLLVLLSIPTLTVNYLWTTFAAIGAIFVIVPAILAMRRARRNRPGEPTIHFRELRRNIGLLNLVLGILLILEAVYVSRGAHTLMGTHLIAVTIGLYVAAAAFLLRFVPFYVVSVVILLAATLPFHVYPAATASGVAGLATGTALWIGTFLVFSRTSQ